MAPSGRGLRAVLLAALAARSPASSCGPGGFCVPDDGWESAALSALQQHSSRLSRVEVRAMDDRAPPRDEADADDLDGSDDADTEDGLTLARVGSAGGASAAAGSQDHSAFLVAVGRPLFCPDVGSLPPLIATASAMVAALLLLRLHIAGVSEQQAARSIYLMVNFFLVLNYTVVILDSYDLCRRVGLSGGASGGMVGMYMLGFCGGAAIMWLCVRCHPSLWREAPKRTLLAGLCPQLLGALLYTWVSAQATGPEHAVPLRRLELLSHVLIASRFISGFGSGTCQQFYVGGMIHITPVAVRGVHTARWVFSGMLAIGLGPVLAVVVQQLHPCDRSAPHFHLVGQAQIVTAVGSSLAVAWLHPSLQDCEDCVESESEDEHVGEAPTAAAGGKLGERGQRRLVVCGCLCMASLRAFGVSAIEVVLAMLLEQTYGWEPRATGLTIGGVFLCCIPLKMVHTAVGDRLSTVAWIRLMAFVALAGSGLLFACVAQPLPLEELHLTGAMQLIAAAIVIFPTFYLSDALGSGLMHQHVLPTGSLLDGNHAQLWYNLMQGMGRFLGPWAGRMTVEARGQDSFAAQQTAVTLAFVLVFEALVRPFLTRVDGGKDAPLQQLSM